VELISADEEHGWERSGDNLVHRIRLSFGEALVGKTIRLEGHPGYAQGLYVHIPAGVTNRQDIVVDGCGMPRSIGSGFGDAVLQLTVLATKEERSILETNKEVLKAMFHASGGDVVPEGTSLKLAKPLVY
jgi:DnaJ-class molecular chaperone